jgi:hypothetical protein
MTVEDSRNDDIPTRPPVVPIGTDGYVQWDRLPLHRIGVRAYMRSTFDRAGNNLSGDGGHFLYQEADDRNVVLDERGPGVLYFVRTNHFHGSPWLYEIDGSPHIVTETGTHNPVGADQRDETPVFEPVHAFPRGLNYTWRDTQGGDIMQTPMPFQRSLRYALGRTYFGTSYAIIHRFAVGDDNFTRPLESWKADSPEPAAGELVESAGSVIAPVDDLEFVRGEVTLAVGPTPIAEVTGRRSVRMLEFAVDESDAERFGAARLRVFWDGAASPSIDAPIALFFGVGHLFNVDDRRFLSRGLMANVEYHGSRVTLRCYWPMPFLGHARIEIVGADGIALEFAVGHEDFDAPAGHFGYFHATYTDHQEAVQGKYIQFLDTDEVEGGGPWAGHLVGLSWIFTHSGRVMPTVEGHPRFILDDSRTPQGVGTGTEEFAGGGSHWRGGNYSSLGLYGHPVGRMGGRIGDDPRELINSAYRYLLADLVPFGRRAVLELKHGSHNDGREHYEGVAYWYGTNDASLILTDTVDVCAGGPTHGLVSSDAQPPYELTSRFENGPHEDYFAQNEYYPEHTGMARSSVGVTEFDADILPENLGLMLRRRFDFRYPNQLARVSVCADGEWHEVGEWYSPGSSTMVLSAPWGDTGDFTEDELLPPQHVVLSSEKHWKEDEFLIAARFTAGQSRVRIRLEHIPVERDLHPGFPFPERSCWSEGIYFVFSYRLPTATLRRA